MTLFRLQEKARFCGAWQKELFYEGNCDIIYMVISLYVKVEIRGFEMGKMTILSVVLCILMLFAVHTLVKLVIRTKKAE